MSPKELVKQFYENDLVKTKIEVHKFFHKDCELHWNSSQGFQIMNYDDVFSFFKNINENYISLRYENSHFLEEEDFVTTRYTVYGRTIENDDEETPLAHYICIWQIKDGKLFKGHQISLPANETTIQTNSFSEIKV